MAMLRSLSAAGVRVIAVDRYKYAPGLYSRRAHRTVRLDTDDTEATLRFLEELEGVDGAVLFPTNDFYTEIVANNIDRLSRRFVITTQRWDVLDPVLDKARLYKMARPAGVETPVHFTPATADEVQEILVGLDFARARYIFSLPPTSPEPADPHTVRYTIPAGESLEVARTRATELFQRTGVPPVIQEVIPGDAERCLGVVMIVDQEHRVVGSRVVRRRKLYSYFSVDGFAYGGNVSCESIHDDEAVRMAAAIVKETKLTGAITVELRRRPDGSLVLMKVDVRVVAMVALCSDLGMDVPTLLYRLYTGQPLSIPVDYPDGVRWVWEKPYVWGVLKSGRAAWREIPAAFDTFRKATTFAIWNRADPMPFMVNALGGVRSQVRKRFRKRRDDRRRWEDTPTRPSNRPTP